MTDNATRKFSIDNLSIGKKMVLGFGTILLLLLLMAIIAIVALYDAREDFVSYRSLALETNMAGRLQANLLETRINANGYIRTGSESALENFSSRLNTLRELSQRANEAVNDKSRKRVIETAVNDIEQYGEAFQQVVDFKDRRNQLVEKLNSVGPIIRKELSNIIDSAYLDGDREAAYYASVAKSHLLLGRLYVTKFLDDNAQSSVDRMQKEFELFTEAKVKLDSELQNSARRKMLDKVNEMAPIYNSTFNELVQTIFSRNDVIRNRMDVIGPKVATALEDIKLAVKGEQDTLGPKIQAESKTAITNLLVIASVILVLGIFITAYFIRSLISSMDGVVKIFREVSTGQLDVDIQTDRKDEIGKLLLALHGMVENIRSVVSGINDNAQSVSSASLQISQTAESLSQAAAERATTVEETSSAMQELNCSIKKNTSNAQTTNQNAIKTFESAKEVGQAVSTTIKAMNNIAQKVTVIEEIAKQTNLLALNASIEASRAGDSGKGFSVVAAKVRKLAERTQDAATGIGELTKLSAKQAESAGELINNMVCSTEETADLVSSIADVSNEQANSVNNVNSAVQDIDTAIQQSAASSEELAATSEGMKNQARQLVEAVSFFKMKKSA